MKYKKFSLSTYSSKFLNLRKLIEFRLSKILRGTEAPLVWFLLILILSISAVFIIWSITAYPDFKSANTATLMISIENEPRMFQGEVTENMTVLDALIASAAAGQIHIRYYIRPDNTTEIAEINGYGSALPKNLAFYLNRGRINSEDLNKIKVQVGDIIEINQE